VFALVGFKGETKRVLRAEREEEYRILRELGRGCYEVGRLRCN